MRLQVGQRLTIIIELARMILNSLYRSFHSFLSLLYLTELKWTKKY